MSLKAGGIFNDHFIANLPLSIHLKEFQKSVTIWWSYDENLVSFLTHGVVTPRSFIRSSKLECQIATDHYCWFAIVVVVVVIIIIVIIIIIATKLQLIRLYSYYHHRIESRTYLITLIIVNITPDSKTSPRYHLKRHAVFKNGFWKSARKCCKKKKMLLGYESVTLNIDVMVYIAVLRTITDGKERKLLPSCC